MFAWCIVLSYWARAHIGELNRSGCGKCIKRAAAAVAFVVMQSVIIGVTQRLHASSNFTVSFSIRFRFAHRPPILSDLELIYIHMALSVTGNPSTEWTFVLWERARAEPLVCSVFTADQINPFRFLFYIRMRTGRLDNKKWPRRNRPWNWKAFCMPNANDYVVSEPSWLQRSQSVNYILNMIIKINHKLYSNRNRFAALKNKPRRWQSNSKQSGRLQRALLSFSFSRNQMNSLSLYKRRRRCFMPFPISMCSSTLSMELIFNNIKSVRE